MQSNIWQYYQGVSPGQVQVLGVDLYNGTTSQLNSFKSQTGATYPLFLNGAVATGGNLQTVYGQYDNYVVINKQGIIRYHAYDLWPHGNRYHLDQIRGCVDSLVAGFVGVEDEGPPLAFALRSLPNPSPGQSTVELALPTAVPEATVRVHDLAGRLVATLHEGPLAAGVTRFAFRGRSDSGARLAPGVYLLHARVGARQVERRIVLLR